MLIEANDSYDPNNLMNYSNTNEKADEWNNIMMKFQQKVPGSLPNEWWASMKQVFDSEISSN